jgi:hypothetical protein
VGRRIITRRREKKAEAAPVAETAEPALVTA